MHNLLIGLFSNFIYFIQLKFVLMNLCFIVCIRWLSFSSATVEQGGAYFGSLTAILSDVVVNCCNIFVLKLL